MQSLHTFQCSHGFLLNRVILAMTGKSGVIAEIKVADSLSLDLLGMRERRARLPP